jgi:hypothetical protein
MCRRYRGIDRLRDESNKAHRPEARPNPRVDRIILGELRAVNHRADLTAVRRLDQRWRRARVQEQHPALANVSVPTPSVPVEARRTPRAGPLNSDRVNVSPADASFNLAGGSATARLRRSRRALAEVRRAQARNTKPRPCSTKSSCCIARGVARGSGAPLTANPLPAGRRRSPTDAETFSRRGKLSFDLRAGYVARRK